MLRVLVVIAGCALLLIVLTDVFETIILARRAQQIFRPTRWFYSFTWKAWTFFGRRIRSRQGRERFLSIYGPLSVMSLLVLWAIGLILSFTLIQWALGLRIPRAQGGFYADLILSAGALFTMNLGNSVSQTSRLLMVVEAGMGFSLFGLVVGYLPVFYQWFTDRERRITLLDARAGSPPSAEELITRQCRNPAKLEEQLSAWEEWASSLLEAQLSYPMLAYFRSQHENQSWLGALVTVIDASALALLCGDPDVKHQAELAFAMGRHALADLVSVFRLSPPRDPIDRLPSADFQRLAAAISTAETPLNGAQLSETGLSELRQMYEPFAQSLSDYFLMALPGWLKPEFERDNWLRSSWDFHEPPFSVSDPFRERHG